ncbi:MAG TPA: D-cysteine desulfhydrase family protein [Anaerolineales bacterium]|nr:D-cysteine desulfhydrase family protein [Anaerolineales bacterium]
MKSLPRLKIAHLPTPVEVLPRLSAKLQGPMLLIKRDDQTGLALGGNKTRKLEFLLAEAQANGARTLISAGAVQSNHCRQTAAAAARYGFDCILVLNLPPEKDISPQDMMQPNGNLLLDHILGAEIVWTQLDQREKDLQATFQKAWDEGRRPYMIPYGGSNPTGALGYVFAMQELLDQDSSVDWMIVPSSSAGTQAGLVLGARLFGYTGKILGVSIDEPAERLKAHVAHLASQTADLLGERLEFHSEEILVNADYIGAGYGVMGRNEIDAIKQFASLEGLLLDPVYTGRAAAGLIDLIQQGFFEPSQKVLFWHTGGAPALFADRYRNLV